MQKPTLKGIWEVLKDSYKGFTDDKVPKLGGSLAYFTLFSLGPMLLVIIYLVGIFLGKQAVEGSLTSQIQEVVGEGAALQLQEIIKNISISKQGKVAAIIGIITLFIGATSVFAEIQDSINGIWHLKLKPNQGLMRTFLKRLVSFGVIASLGFLFLVSLVATALAEALGKTLKEMIPGAGVVIFYIISLALTLGMATLLFAIIFKILPDARLKWKDVWPGAIVTAILFMIGRFAISFYIGKSDIGSAYGAAGSLVVLLVWVYYSSLILYFGAEFSKAYAIRFGSGIRPRDYAFSDLQPNQQVKNFHNPNS
ncbi:YihY/virulence factor BrkB family protein [Chitinophagaceae bacterium LB-8]|uniref:YihY/virulence factor BrkB family protein n=1 Tax=Paraflavisolibacter caeni TaxID=2982496 RepID=A0A9X2XX65_9BACT|nr:YihY/virulence factor BrkB family protein [Paraflavisolibacter caeni]MCU7551134.1 YihY/virulence factor BrkB family protein [Paraflavisolibacter caeni]